MEGAKQALLKAINLDDSNVLARNNLGIVLERQGDKDGARQEFRKAHQLAVDFKMAEDNLNRLVED